MSLRKKAISVIFGTMLGIGTLLTALLSGFSIRNFRALEDNEVNRQVVRALNNLNLSIDHIGSISNDWAPWDETYDFLTGKNPQYVHDNLTEGALANLDLSLVALIDLMGKTVWSRTFDLAQRRIASPLSEFGTFSANDALLRHQDMNSGVSGIMKLSENRLMLVASRPITTSDFSAPSVGSLVMGRMLDSYEIGVMSLQTDQEISIVRIDDPAIPRDMSTALSRIGSSDSIFACPIDAKCVAGYSLIRDIYGQPAAVLRVIESRSIYEQGMASIGYTVFALFIAGTVCVIAVTIILDRLVLKRLTLMNTDIARTDTDSRERVRVIGNDELSALANTINTAFDKLEAAESELRASLSEKETLLHEIHHRVKNNLQVVSSLLSLQSDITREQEVQTALRDSQSRIDSMALVHELLYRPRGKRTPDLARIDFRHYLQQLIKHLGQTYVADTSRIIIEVEVDGLFLDTDTAITCGLIVNELVSNSAKYAFPEDRAGTIHVLMRTNEAGEIVLMESDDGIGFPPGIDLMQTDSMGWLLVRTLVSQLEGRFEIQSPGAGNRGSSVRIIFPL